MAKKEALRSALTAAPSVLVMKPSGVIIQAPFAKNLRGGPIEFRDGKPRLRDKYRDRGWRLFDDVADPAQREFWQSYVATGDKTRGRIKVDGALVERMRPHASKEARDRHKKRDHLRVPALEELVPDKPEPKPEPKGAKKAEASKPSDKPEPKPEPKG
jgi:hypothetical protein